MAIDVKPVKELLANITDAFVAAKDAFPEDLDSFVPPQDGISLLDMKNDLLLSYLQHLVFLLLLRLRNASSQTPSDAGLGKDVVKKLIELRAYLDRGVRPLEGRLRYQIDKVLRTAEDAERIAAQKSQPLPTKKSRKSFRPEPNGSDASIVDSDLEDESAGSDSAEESDEAAANVGPNRALLSQAARTQAMADASKQKSGSAARYGVYKPPRLNPVAMPESNPRAREDAEDNRLARRRKNALLDEYVNEEHSAAPIAQPSIGSNNTILARGRQHTTLQSRDRDKERERTDYEERNFVRLPDASKAERRKDRAKQMRDSRELFGGEDWTGLGGLGDRIGKSVERGRARESVLERREKRKRDIQDMPRGDGVGIGESFEKRRKVLQNRSNKKTRR